MASVFPSEAGTSQANGARDADTLCPGTPARRRGSRGGTWPGAPGAAHAERHDTKDTGHSGNEHLGRQSDLSTLPPSKSTTEAPRSSQPGCDDFPARGATAREADTPSRSRSRARTQDHASEAAWPH